MNKKTFVKCKYYDTFAWSKPSVREKDRIIIGDHYEYFDKVIVGEFTRVVWDGEKRALELGDGRKKIHIKEFDYQFCGDYAEKEHIGTCIEYLAIDDFVIIDEQKENASEET